MTILRNAAKRLADFTTRHASPGTKVWAEALANELDAIQSDWRALAWAFGSMRVLVYYRPKPFLTLEELNAAAEKHASRRRHAMNNIWLGRNLPWMVFALNACMQLMHLPRSRHFAADCMYIGMMLSTSLTMYLTYREPNVPDRDDPSGMIRFYRQDTARRVRILALSVPAPCFAMASIALQLKHHPWVAAPIETVLIALLLLIISQCLSRRRQLAQIDAFLATGQDH